MAIIAFLSRSPGLLNRGPGGSVSLGHVPQSSIFSPTDWTSCAPSYIIIWHPLFFLWASQITLIQPVHGQGYILIFLDRMHLLFTQVHFLFWQFGWVGGQYTTIIPYFSKFHMWNFFTSVCITLTYTFDKIILQDNKAGKNKKKLLEPSNTKSYLEGDLLPM